ncbi:QRFP-like peptide receptor [Branchiostoma floridae x Branchiostoma belcheri]
MSNRSNVTFEPIPVSPLSTEALTVVTVLHAVIFIIGTAGNATVCVVSFFGASARKIQRTPIKVFLANLSVADLLFLLISVPVALVKTWIPYPWVFGSAMCKLQPMAEYLFYHSSVLTVVVIAVERYKAIFCPLKIKFLQRRKRTAAILFSIWTISLIFSIPFTQLATLVQQRHGEEIVDFCEFRADSTASKLYYVAVSVLFFFVPFFVLAVAYVAIWWRLRVAAVKRNRQLQGRRGESNIRPSQDQPKEVVILFLSFLICLLPQRSIQLWMLFAPNDEIEGLGEETIAILIVFLRTALYVYCTINPALYNLFASQFQLDFKKFRSLNVKRSDRLRGNDIEMSCYGSCNVVWSLSSNNLGRLRNYTVPPGRPRRGSDGLQTQNTRFLSVRHSAQTGVLAETCC